MNLGSCQAHSENLPTPIIDFQSTLIYWVHLKHALANFDNSWGRYMHECYIPKREKPEIIQQVIDDYEYLKKEINRAKRYIDRDEADDAAFRAMPTEDSNKN